MAIRFWGGAYFLENLLAWRLIAIEGRLGGGKTSLSVAMARWIYENRETTGVDGVFANFPIDPSFIPVKHSCVNSVVILDEGWSFADARKSLQKFEGYGAYARKLNMYLISPGINPVDKRMRQMKVKRELDLWLFDAWLYRWSNVDGDAGRFLLTGYRDVFGAYDHRFIPADDGGIKETLFHEISALAGSTRKIFTVGGEHAVVSPYLNPLEVKVND